MKGAEHMTPTKEESIQVAGHTEEPMLPIEQEIARGLRFTHIMINAIHRQETETVRLIEGLNRLLAAKGITSDTEWADALDNPARIPQDLEKILSSLQDKGQSRCRDKASF